ncbi:stemmadenine O-acetyltransferase-like [Silene latifolia]|uniref:stemmadenine O-acetyltransferase-like n=1 Tax=Silene latifolia TaxID=37657 RepID=UPI003D787D92
MAKFNAEIKSKDVIKPFSETANHLKTLQFTFIDQLAPPVLMPLIFYYKTPIISHYNNSETTTLLLKNSLSKTLVQFYPLAGRVVGNSSIDCNDEGVEFYEADVLASLAEVIANPDPEELIRLLPYAPKAPISNNISVASAVQLNHFSCGSMAISVCISHKIADATTFVAFLNAWACNTRDDGYKSDNDQKLVSFDSASFLPSIDLNEIYDHESPICKEKIVSRRLVFSKDKLDELKGLESRPVSRVTVVSAFLWNKFIKFAKVKPTPPKIMSSATQAVNLRTIKSSPIPENCYGNLFWTKFVHTPIESDYTEAVRKLRESSKHINTSLLQEIETGECLLSLQETYKNFTEGELGKDIFVGLRA